MASFLKQQRKTISLALFLAGVALAYTFPIFQDISYWGIQDWDQHLFYHAVPRLTWLEYGQMPLWNPYAVGGMVMLANPQSRLLAPSYLLVLIFGEVVGVKLEIWLHVGLGLAGMFALARHYYRLSRPAALLAAFVFMLNSMMALSLTVGMTWFMAVAYIPWAVLFYFKALEQRLSWGLASGFCLALIFLNGGAYPLPMTLLFFLIYAAILGLFQEYCWTHLLKCQGLITLSMLLFGAIKFFPALEFQRLYPRTLIDYSGYSLETLAFALFSREQSLDAIQYLAIEQPGFLRGVTGGMDENGMYIGLLPFLLFIVGIGLNDRRRMFLFLAGLIFLWLSFGNRPRAELWSLLHLFPVFGSMRLAQRFRLFFILAVAIFAGFGFETAKGYLARLIPDPKWHSRLSQGLVALILLDLLLVSAPIFKEAFPIPPLAVRPGQAFYQVAEFPSYGPAGWLVAGPAELPPIAGPAAPFSTASGPRYGQTAEGPSAYTSPLLIHASHGALYPALLANVGTIQANESAEVPRKATPRTAPDYQGEVYLQATTGRAEIVDWSPNRWRVVVEATGPGYLLFNQNYYPGWRVANPAGRVVENVDQRLAVAVSAGRQTVELYYRPASFVIGTMVTLTTILFAAIYSINPFRRRVGISIPSRHEDAAATKKLDLHRA